jgi:cytidine deaminase
MIPLIEPALGATICLIRVGKKWVIGTNDRNKTSPAFKKFLPDGSVLFTRHAEAHAIQLAERQGGRMKRVMVIRWKKNGEMAMAKPCYNCLSKLREKGIKDNMIYFTNETGEVQCMGRH